MWGWGGEGVAGDGWIKGAFQTATKAPEIKESKAYLGNVSNYITELKRVGVQGPRGSQRIRLERKAEMNHNHIYFRDHLAGVF